MCDMHLWGSVKFGCWYATQMNYFHFILLLGALMAASGCYRSDSIGHGEDSGTSEMDDGTGGTHTDSNVDGADSDTGTGQRIVSDCDGLTLDACQDSDEVCGQIYALPVAKLDGESESSFWIACDGRRFLGCTALKNCDDDGLSTTDESGKCWWIPNGCRPLTPGWSIVETDENCDLPRGYLPCID